MKINPTKAIDELITALSYIIDVEKNKKLYHSWLTAVLSARFSKKRKNSKELKEIFYAALLHDIGGVEFSHHIIYYLKKQTKINQNSLLAHPIIGAQLVSNIPCMTEAAKLILDHHEWINGTGYPRAKTGNNIPYGAQIIRLADSIDIALHKKRFSRLKELKDSLSGNVQKEFSKKLFDYAFAKLKQNRFFYKIILLKNIPIIFKKIKNEIGTIHIPERIDAIGQTLEVISQIIDMKHPYTSGHSLRVSRYAITIALAMNLNHDEITYIKWAGFIHDIGKLTVPRQILEKPTSLTFKEYQKIQKHVIYTKQILKMLPSLERIATIASSHHEYYDGSGYPKGLKGDQIPLGAKILVICDAFDAMTSNRPYRKTLTPEQACKEIKKLSGKQFDPEISKHAIAIFKNLGL